MLHEASLPYNLVVNRLGETASVNHPQRACLVLFLRAKVRKIIQFPKQVPFFFNILQ